MDCQELVELVTDYLEETLAEPMAHEVEAHLQGCLDCLRYLGQIQLTTRLLNRLSEDAAG